MSVAARVTALSSETLDLELSDAILTVHIHRPKALNALSPHVIAELRQVFGLLREELGQGAAGSVGERADVGPDWSIRGVIITGSGGKAFVAGADITAMQAMGREEAHAYASDAHELTRWIEELPVPVIAAVNGFALGGGLELAMACDLILASENAVFGQPEVGLGLIPGFGGCVRLQQYVGIARAKEMILTGRKISAEEALSSGLVLRVLPDGHALLQAAHETALKSAAQSPAAVSAAKRTIQAVRSLSNEEGLALERDAFADCFDTADGAEGMAAFVEKRRPNFLGA